MVELEIGQEFLVINGLKICFSDIKWKKIIVQYFLNILSSRTVRYSIFKFGATTSIFKSEPNMEISAALLRS